MSYSPWKVEKFFWAERIYRIVSAERKRLFAARILAAVLAATGVALALPALASAGYGWPIKPFGQEHPVRGQLNDPRMDGLDFFSSKCRAFHFGIDIAAPDGTAVYSVAPGRVHYLSPNALAVRTSGKATSNFAYWHIRPAVKNGKKVKLHALLGYVAPGYGHLHFAENRNGRYVNPLRRGALTPYSDSTAPTIASLEYYDGRLPRPRGCDAVGGNGGPHRQRLRHAPAGLELALGDNHARPDRVEAVRRRRTEDHRRALGLRLRALHARSAHGLRARNAEEQLVRRRALRLLAWPALGHDQGD